MEQERVSSTNRWRFRIAVAVIFVSPIAATSNGILLIYAMKADIVPAGLFPASHPFSVIGLLGGLGAAAGVVVLPICARSRGVLLLLAFPLGCFAAIIAAWTVAIVWFNVSGTPL